VAREGEAEETAATTEEEEEEPSRILWVGNIGPDVTEKELGQEFSQYGKIESLRILHHRYCAFVNFEDEKSAKEVILLANIAVCSSLYYN
jgi:protein JSN1